MVIGEQLGDYLVIDELGRGGMGVVYLARQEGLDRVVALKVLPVADAQLADRMRREVRALAALQSPFIVPIFDVGDAIGRPFFAMAYCAGGSLADVLKSQGPLSPGQVVQAMSSVASALAAIHAAGMVHRDVKTSNVLVTAEGRTLVADLGLVGGLEGSRVTTSGAVMGTLGSMAPELLDDEEPSPASDTFALGVLGYELASGRQPFAGRNMSAVLDAVRRGHYPPLVEAAPAVPPALAALIEEAMRHDPAQRPADLEDYADRLSAVAKPERLRPVQRAEVTNATTMSDRRSGGRVNAASASVPVSAKTSRSCWRVGVGIAAALALAGGAFWAFRDDGSAISGAADSSGVSSTTGVASVAASLDLPEQAEADGVKSVTSWQVLSDGRVQGVTVLQYAGEASVVHQHDEWIPKELAASADVIVATPDPASVPKHDPVLRFCLKLTPGVAATITWTAPAPSPAVTQADLDRLKASWPTAVAQWDGTGVGTQCTADVAVEATTTTSTAPATPAAPTPGSTKPGSKPTAPSVPTSVTMSNTIATGLVPYNTSTSGNAVKVAWSAPASDGGSPITGYQVTLTGGAYNQTKTVAASATTVVFDSVPYSTALTAAVTTKNSVGTGAATSKSATSGAYPTATNIVKVELSTLGSIQINFGVSRAIPGLTCTLLIDSANGHTEWPISCSFAPVNGAVPGLTYSFGIRITGGGGGGSTTSAGSWTFNRAPDVYQDPVSPAACSGVRNLFDFGPAANEARGWLMVDPDGDPVTAVILGYGGMYDFAGPDGSDVISFSVNGSPIYVTWQARDSHGALSPAITQYFHSC